MPTPTITTAPATEPEAQSEFCDCARDGDRWMCRSRDAQGYPRSCEPGSGLTCSLRATVTATGQDDWSRVDARKLRACPCGRPRRAA